MRVGTVSLRRACCRWLLLSVAFALLPGCARLSHSHGILPFTPRTATVIADTGGPIAELAIHFLANSEIDLEPTYTDLFSALPPDVNLQVLCPSELDVDEFLRRWGNEASARGRSVQVINVHRPLTLWSRDRRIARQVPGSDRAGVTVVPATVPDYGVDKRAELTIPQALVSAGVLAEVVTAKLHVEGGNIVANRRQAFIGANVYADNAEAFQSREEIDCVLKDILGVPYFVLSDGNDHVPWCHADMYVTPVDDETILVASPSLTLCLLSSIESCPDGREAERGESEFAEMILAQDERLDIVADRLAAAGYKVHRVPAILDPNKDWMVTYNNVLMECRDGRRVVYMPVYRLGILDSAAASVYESLGFVVQPIDVSGIYRDGGTIRCIANVTGRRACVGAPMRVAVEGTPVDAEWEPGEIEKERVLASEMLQSGEVTRQ